MDRGIIYPGQVPLETDLLFAQKASMIGLAKLAAAVLGVGTLANGLATTQTTVPSMAVSVAAGEIYMLANIDGTAYSSIALDTTHSILKQGINLDATTLAIAAPGTAGFSTNYLIQATFSEVDSTPVVLPYYNASNPATAYSGPANASTTQNTRRLGQVTLSAKSGTSATTGTQTTPAPDSGYVGLYVVTVANGAASVVNANISAYSGAPFLNSGMLGQVATLLNTPPQFDNTTKAATTAFVQGAIGAISYRNKILNGAFRTNRRGYVSGTALAAGVPATGVGYGHDGWRAGAGGGTYTFAQLKSATQITITAGTMITAMEDADIDQTSMILSWTGTATARIGVNGAAPSGGYVASPILIACTAGQQVSAEFGVGTLGTVQAENGAVRTPMEWVSQQQQDTRCQRYLPSVVSANGSNSPVCYAYANSATQATALWNFPVKARVAPTGLLGRASSDFTVNYSVGIAACTGFTFNIASYDGMQINCTVASGLTVNAGCNIFMNNAAGYLLATGAEL